jgi:hypothetical protein
MRVYDLGPERVGTGKRPAVLTKSEGEPASSGEVWGKVLIYDGDRCAPGEAGTPDYSGFLFPFTSNNPGPQGFSGSITFKEADTLTTGVPTGPVTDTDAVGDANTFTSNAGGWCEALGGTNGNGVNGIQEAYARTSTGGLAVYAGFDVWFTFGPNSFDKTVVDNMVAQPWNPDGLPCGVPVTGIKLAPLSATNPVGGTHTVTATVSDSAGNPIAGVTVTFTVQSGPNAGRTGTGVTNASGQATFTYSDTGGAGTDTIVATFTDANGTVHTSNTVTKTWSSSGPVCGTPTVATNASGQVVSASVTVTGTNLASVLFTTLNNATANTSPTGTPAGGATAAGQTITLGSGVNVVTVTATKGNPAAPAALGITVTDAAGNSVHCDPPLAPGHSSGKGGGHGHGKH